ncbi:type I restriction-modification system DNA methylase subunit [Chryseobacterium ginsenosidimutans]|uniref:type I restriction-modification system subunit M N-terminal domain-containing protein n=1 Tax=Chryseobacterium ginsenosidimutans TaxID=687846 RepID=UPI00216727E5|nr:type I restriction-modification system subunit M N-terminal domain-containing protein [Chryseobacterium ginsenosidimutans]MCS3870689.1 type I restriction-modification system DNA methylase subunit [Chryseobacterium ginsenosidimutans]
MTEAAIVSKIWNLANVMRHDGVGYGDYLEQITYLLFLKMVDELNKPPYNRNLQLPRLKDVEGKEVEGAEVCSWENLTSKNGAETGVVLHSGFAFIRYRKRDAGANLREEPKQNTRPI